MVGKLQVAPNSSLPTTALSAVPFKAKILHKLLLLTSKGSGKRPGCRCRVNQKRMWWAKTFKKKKLRKRDEEMKTSNN